MKKGKGKNNGLLLNSLRIISLCLKTVSTNATSVAATVRSAGASVAASISSASEDHKDQIYFFDAVTLENKFSVLTYPVPQLAGQGTTSVNVGYGPMAVGPRWLAYASNNPLSSNLGCLSPHSLSSSSGVGPSTSPSSGSLVARYAMESGRHLAAGIIKYCQELLPDGSTSPMPSNSGGNVGRVTEIDMDNAGMVVIVS